MKRELKFRAYNKTTYKMNYYVEIYCYKDGSVGYSAGENNNNPIGNSENFELNQFTGLKDKNGVEIYEGDILKTETDKNMVVGWSNKHASFVLEREGWMFKHYFGEAADPEYVEVIGNIYQNAELLQAIA